MSDVLPHSTVTAAVDARHWRVLLGTLRATFRTPDWATGTEFVARVARAADAADHHPDVLLRYGQVTVTTSSHDVGGLTVRDVDLAADVTALADELGLAADVTAGEVVEIAVDALDIPGVRPFWQAVLAYRDVPGDPDALEDPAGTAPRVWFQQMDAPRPQRNRLHLDVTVPHDLAEARVAAALAAGGRLVADDAAPSFWVLADAEGNEACVCTWQARPTA